METLIPILIVAILILLNAVFVAAEFAIIGAPRAAIERRAASGQRIAVLVRDILHDPRQQDRYIATAQLGITFASLGLGMYGEHMLAGWIVRHLENWGAPGWLAAHTLASALAIAVLTYFHIVVGEMVPKSLALSHAERTVLWITRPMLWTKAALYPLVVGLNGVGNAVLRLLGVRRELTSSRYYSPEELEMIVEESAMGGMLRKESSQLVREVFDFAELTAAEVMVPRVQTISLKMSSQPEEMRAMLRAHSHTRYPVHGRDLDDIIGVIHIKRLVRAISEERSLSPEDLHPAVFVPATARLNAVLDAMSAASTELAAVMDEHGGVAGILTTADLFAEVIGHVREPGAVEQDLLRVPGTLRIAELGERLGLALEHDQVDSISGLVLALINGPPQPGDVVRWKGLKFQVVLTRGRGVRECVVTRENEGLEPG